MTPPNDDPGAVPTAAPVRAKRMPPDWQPPVPAWSADIATPSGQLVMAYLATQLRNGDEAEHRRRMSGFLAAGNAPDRVEQARFADRRGVANAVSIAYWTSPARYAAWRAGSGYEGWWRDAQRLHDANGHFEEVLTLPVERLETLFSSGERPAGVGATVPKLKGPVREHNYWGSMRDRLALSARDDLAGPYGEALPRLGATNTEGRRLRVFPPENLAVIRSGQDWSQCGDAELRSYDGSVRPALVEGMRYLSEHSDETGCCDMRFAAEVAGDGTPLKQAFGLGYFLTLGHLERWAASHPTHLAIFHRFIDMAKQHDGRLGLRLWHEVSVLPGAGQSFEYVNCHAETGLLPYFPSEQIEATVR